MKSKILILLLIFSIGMTGCRNYTNSRVKDTETGSYSENDLKNALDEEQAALNNAPKLSNDSTILQDALNKCDDLKMDKTIDVVIYKSKNFEFQFGANEIGVIYFTIYNSHPLNSEKTMTELYRILEIIMEILGEDFDQKPIVKCLENLDYSKSNDIYENDYSDKIKLFSSIWNDGFKNCVDFRINPKD